MVAQIVVEVLEVVGVFRFQFLAVVLRAQHRRGVERSASILLGLLGDEGAIERVLLLDVLRTA